jgi:alpha-tubulin suppressor-like RCC1 family protein
MMQKLRFVFVSMLLLVSMLAYNDPVKAVESSDIMTNTVVGGQMEAGMYSSFYVDTYSVLWAWGSNGYYQLGTGNNVNQYDPVKIMENVQMIAAGDRHGLALQNDGSLWAWGENFWGAVGDGSTETRKTPVKIMENVVSVAAGGYHSLAIKSDGSLWAWGNNENGRLGDGTTINRLSPVKVLEGVASVSGGGFHSAAIKTDGSLWVWGRNGHYQLGTGDYNDKLIPYKLMENVASVSAGYIHTFAIKKDASLWAWGTNWFGQLGDGTTTDRLTPKKIMDGVSRLSAGTMHTLALKTDGSLWAWGTNQYGQLGNKSTDNSFSPIQVMESVIDFSAGEEHSLAIQSDGTLWAWGRNNQFQLGTLNIDYSYSPIAVSIPYANIVSISMLTLPTKTSYIIGETFEVAGAKLSLNLSDNSSLTTTITSSMVSGFDAYASEFGPQTITVTYDVYTTTFQVYLVRFSDVPYGHRNYAHINALVVLGIINGYSDSTFRPNNTLTRAQAAIMIVRAAGISTEGVSSSFTDVPPTHAAYKFISAAYQAGIINGYSDGTFRPNANVTRAQIAIMVQRAFNVQASETIITFTDVPEGYAPKKFIETLASQKIVNGYSDGTFKPLNNVTRAQFSTMIYNAIQYANTLK